MQTRHFLNNPVQRVHESDYQQALVNTQKFTKIGLTEEYDQFSTSFFAENNLTMPTASSALNRSKAPPLFSIHEQEIREILLPLVRYDLKLYEQICRAKKFPVKDIERR